MTRRTDTTDAPELNLTPMIDVVFLLVIFFLVGARYSGREGRIDVEVPGVGHNAPLVRGVDEQIVTVAQDGGIHYRDRQLDLPTLAAEMQSAVAAYPDLRVTVRGDGGGRLDTTVQVLETVRRAGVRRVAIATQPREKY